MGFHWSYWVISPRTKWRDMGPYLTLGPPCGSSGPKWLRWLPYALSITRPCKMTIPAVQIFVWVFRNFINFRGDTFCWYGSNLRFLKIQRTISSTKHLPFHFFCVDMVDLSPENLFGSVWNDSWAGIPPSNVWLNMSNHSTFWVEWITII